MERVKEVNDALTKLVLQVEFFALSNLLPALEKVSCTFINVLQEVLGCSFQEKDLVVVITMMGQVTAFFTNQLIVKAAIGYVSSSMIRAEVLPESSAWVLLI